MAIGRSRPAAPWPGRTAALLRLAEEPKITLQSTETVDYAWLTPVELLERCRAGMVIGHLAERFARYAVMLEDVLQKEGEK